MLTLSFIDQVLYFPIPEFIENVPLASLEPSLRTSLKENAVVFEKFAKFFLIEHAKILYILFFNYT